MYKRQVGRWLTDNGVAWALSTDCCGSPLMSAGLFDRAAALRQRILDQIRAAGIVRVVTVCPGCGEEFVELMGDEVDIVPLPELLLQKSRAAERAGRPTGFAPLPEQMCIRDRPCAFRRFVKDLRGDQSCGEGQ